MRGVTAIDTVERRHLDRLIQASQALVQVLDHEVVLAQLLDTAREVTGARFAALGILDEDRARFSRFIASGMTDDEQQALGEPPVGHGLFGTVIRAMRPVRVGDVARHPDSSGFPDGHPPMASFLGVPVMQGDEAWGVIYCAEQADGAFTAEHEELLVLLAGWASIAVHNADLYERSEADRAELEHVLHAYRASREVAQAIGSDVELDHVLELIAERAQPLVQASTVLVLLAEGPKLTVAAGAGREAVPSAAADVPVAPPESTIIQELGAEDRAYWAALGAPAAASALIAPMIFRGEPVGLIAAFRADDDGDTPFTAADQELLESYAVSAATRVTIARSVQRERLLGAVAAADAERRRWARELHDQTLQGLAALRLLLHSGDSTAAVAVIDEEIVNLRAILADLRPPSLDEHGWSGALESLVDRRRRADGPEITLTVDPATESADADLLAEAFRIVQEALSNALHHADATSISINVGSLGGALSVSVRDDGHGFDPAATGGGFGLVGMRERVQLAGGSLDIQTGAGGTTVTVALGPR